MKREQIIRAWKDEDYRLGLSVTELSALPEHPSGMVQVLDDELQNVGGQIPTTYVTLQTMDAICFVTMIFCEQVPL